MSKEARRILRKKKLGEILRSLEIIDEDKLDRVIKAHEGSKMKLGQLLSYMGYVDQEVLLSLVGKQIGAPYIKVSEYGSISEQVLENIPKAIALKHIVIPFDIEKNTLKVAMADPQEEHVRELLSAFTNMDLEIYIAAEEDIISSINSNYCSD